MNLKCIVNMHFFNEIIIHESIATKTKDKLFKIDYL